MENEGRISVAKPMLQSTPEGPSFGLFDLREDPAQVLNERLDALTATDSANLDDLEDWASDECFSIEATRVA